MEKVDIFTKIIEILNYEKNKYLLEGFKGNITINTSLFEDLSLDFIQTLELIIDIEDLFGFRMDFQKLTYESISTIGNLVNIVENQVSNRKDI